MQQLTLKYQNEDDKAYGLAGMAIALAALDALDRVAGVSPESFMVMGSSVKLDCMKNR